MTRAWLGMGLPTGVLQSGAALVLRVVPPHNPPQQPAPDFWQPDFSSSMLEAALCTLLALKDKVVCRTEHSHFPVKASLAHSAVCAETMGLRPSVFKTDLLWIHALLPRSAVDS